MVHPIIGESRVIGNIKTLISKVARSGENTLICGETGVGKDLAAQNLYHQSKRVEKPFVKLNCGCLTESLFGIEISSFGQTETREPLFSKKSGLFEKINGGVLYLDNIDLLSPAHQSEILSFLQNDEPKLLNRKARVPLDICMISSSKQNLEKMIEKGKFNESLYFRLSTFRIDIDPLRKRPEDIPSLIDYYCTKYGSAYNIHKMMTLLNKGAKDELCAYYWPGNVRELQNIVKRFIFLRDTVKDISDLISLSNVGYKSIDDEYESTKEMIRHSNSFSDYFSKHASELMSLPLRAAKKKITDMAEKELISHALEKTEWNRSIANKILGISYKTLLSKIDRLNIQPSQPWSGVV